MIHKKTLILLQIILGGMLLASGSFWLKSEEARVLSGLCMGFGAALFTLGLGGLLIPIVVPKSVDPAYIAAKRIDSNDERSERIREKAGYMTARIMVFAVEAFIVGLLLLQVDTVVIALAVSLLFVQLSMAIIFSSYYARRL